MSTAASQTKNPLRPYKTIGILFGPASVFMVVGALVYRSETHERSIQLVDDHLHKNAVDIARIEGRVASEPERANPLRFDQARSDPQHRDDDTRVFAGASPTAAAPVVTLPFPTNPATTPEPAVPTLARFTSPKDREHTKRDTLSVAGTADPRVKGALFLFACPELSVRCWPQSPDDNLGLPALRDGNEWRTVGYLGGPPQSYRLVLYSATPAAARELGAYLKRAAARDSHAGLLPGEFPAGLERLDEITIFKD